MRGETGNSTSAVARNEVRWHPAEHEVRDLTIFCSWLCCDLCRSYVPMFRSFVLRCLVASQVAAFRYLPARMGAFEKVNESMYARLLLAFHHRPDVADVSSNGEHCRNGGFCWKFQDFGGSCPSGRPGTDIVRSWTSDGVRTNG